VYLDLSPRAVDINVHPQKVEVRFAEPSRVYSAVRSCINDALADGSWRNEAPPARVYRLRSAPESESEQRDRLVEATRRFWSVQRDREAPRLPLVAAEGDGRSTTYRDRRPGTEASEGGYFGSLQVVGQVLGTYLVCEKDGELVLVDQHAAHERVTFERLRAATRRGSLPAQRLLVPVSLELEPSLDAVARERAETLAALGFELEPFGGATWTLRAVPGLIGDAAPERLLHDVLDELRLGGDGQIVSQARDAVLAKMACHGSVRAGRVLSETEVKALLAAMDGVDFATNCPHGRPVMVRMTRAELEARFGRA
jgi:DNA mismatch repair protein MutL